MWTVVSILIDNTETCELIQVDCGGPDLHAAVIFQNGGGVVKSIGGGGVSA